MEFAASKRQRGSTQETGRRQGPNDETSIYSQLVSHSARPLSVDDIPVDSICAVASALARFSYFVSQRRWRIGLMKTPCTASRNEHSDGALVAATKRGNAQAFEELVLRHRQKVLAVAQRITNNWEDAEDVAQESLTKAYLHLDAFQEKSQFSTWLTRIAMNEAFMLLRRRRGVVEILPENPDDGMKSGLEAFVDQSLNPEESCWQRERTELLSETINRLGPTIRTAILLRYLEDRSVKETARILGASVSAVKARVFKGRRKLRRTLNPGFLRGLYTTSQHETQRC
jgi:RNA polymerase sigma-70 factor, ECF subfamily